MQKSIQNALLTTVLPREKHTSTRIRRLDRSDIKASKKNSVKQRLHGGPYDNSSFHPPRHFPKASKALEGLHQAIRLLGCPQFHKKVSLLYSACRTQDGLNIEQAKSILVGDLSNLYLYHHCSR